MLACWRENNAGWRFGRLAGWRALRKGGKCHGKGVALGAAAPAGKGRTVAGGHAGTRALCAGCLRGFALAAPPFDVARRTRGVGGAVPFAAPRAFARRVVAQPLALPGVVRRDAQGVQRLPVLCGQRLAHARGEQEQPAQFGSSWHGGWGFEWGRGRRRRWAQERTSSGRNGAASPRPARAVPRTRCASLNNPNGCGAGISLVGCQQRLPPSTHKARAPPQPRNRKTHLCDLDRAVVGVGVGVGAQVRVGLLAGLGQCRCGQQARAQHPRDGHDAPHPGLVARRSVCWRPGVLVLGHSCVHHAGSRWRKAPTWWHVVGGNSNGFPAVSRNYRQEVPRRDRVSHQQGVASTHLPRWRYLRPSRLCWPWQLPQARPGWPSARFPSSTHHSTTSGLVGSKPA